MIGANKRNVNIRADKQSWTKRKRKGRGGGFEYLILDLPEDIQQALAKRHAEHKAKTFINQIDQNSAASVRSAEKLVVEMNRKEELTAKNIQKNKENGAARFNGLSDKAQNRATAKTTILHCYATFILPYRAKGQEVKGLKLFVEQYNAREITLPKWVYGSVNKISKAFKYRWNKALEMGGISALGGNYGVTGRKSIIAQQPEVQDFLQALICQKPHLAKKKSALHKSLMIMQQTEYPDWVIPSSDGVDRWVKSFIEKHSAEFAFVTNPDAYNSKHRPLFGSVYMFDQLERPNDIWEFDSTPVDAMLKDGRHSIIAVIDVFSRRVKLWVAPTSSSEGVCLLLRKTILDWGMLNEGGRVVTDNGQDYISKRVTSLFSMLDFVQHRTNPFSGWEKGFIERFFRTLSHSIVELLPGYIGHNVSDRKQIEAAKSFAERIGKKETRKEQKAIELRLTGAELQQFLDDWLEYHYHHTEHGELKDTPFNIYQNSAYQPKTVNNPDALNLLLNFIGEATVVRGIVKAGNVKYTAPELQETLWDRARVRVFIDPSDVGRAVLYPISAIQEDVQWIEAVNKELIGREISPQAFQQRRKDERKVLSNFRKTSKALAETFGIDDIAAKELAYYKAKNGNLAAFPQPSLPHENGMLSALDDYKPISSINNENIQPQYSDAELEAISARRELRGKQQAMLAEDNAKGMRTEREQAQFLAEKSLHTQLTEKEDKWFKNFMRSHVMAARRINKFLESARHQPESKLTGDML